MPPPEGLILKGLSTMQAELITRYVCPKRGNMTHSLVCEVEFDTHHQIEEHFLTHHVGEHVPDELVNDIDFEKGLRLLAERLPHLTRNRQNEATIRKVVLTVIESWLYDEANEADEGDL